MTEREARSGTRRPLASVVIPAHNEAAVLGRCLRALLGGTERGELDVVVVANGCRDGTAAVGRAVSVRVLETPTASKVAALRLGDSACRTFPRVYLDADVELSAVGVRTLVSRLEASTTIHACAPVPQLDFSDVGALTRRAVRVHQLLMARRRRLSGAGAFVLSAVGHDRTFPLPDVLSDDEWTNRGFAPSERLVAEDVHCIVRPPRTLRAVVRRGVRVHESKAELASLGRPATELPLQVGELWLSLWRRELSVLEVACFLIVSGLVRTACIICRVKGTGGSWRTDRTSRAVDMENRL